MSKTARMIGTNVLLRAPVQADRAEFIALNRASKRFHRGLISPPTTPEQFATFLKRSNTDTSIYLFICLVTDGSIIGALSLSQIFRGGFMSAYLGYYVGAQYAGQGYMTEALQLTLRHAFRNLKLHRLEANIQPDNVASIALVKRAGFVLEDTRNVISRFVGAGVIMNAGPSPLKLGNQDAKHRRSKRRSRPALYTFKRPGKER